MDVMTWRCASVFARRRTVRRRCLPAAPVPTPADRRASSRSSGSNCSGVKTRVDRDRDDAEGLDDDHAEAVHGEVWVSRPSGRVTVAHRQALGARDSGIHGRGPGRGPARRTGAAREPPHRSGRHNSRPPAPFRLRWSLGERRRPARQHLHRPDGGRGLLRQPRGGVPRGWTARLLRGSGHASIRVSPAISRGSCGSHAPRIGDAVPRPARRRLASCCGGWPTPRPACCSWSGPSSGTTRSSSARGPASCSCRICDCCAGSGSGSCSSSPAAMRDRLHRWRRHGSSPGSHRQRMHIACACEEAADRNHRTLVHGHRQPPAVPAPLRTTDGRIRGSGPGAAAAPRVPSRCPRPPAPPIRILHSPSNPAVQAQSWCARRSTVSWPRACSSSSSRSGTCPTGRCTRNCRRATS